MGRTFPVTSALKDMDDIRLPCVVRALTWALLLLNAPLMNSTAALEHNVYKHNYGLEVLGD